MLDTLMPSNFTYRLCRKFDAKLRKILEDCKYYIEDSTSSTRLTLRSASESLAYNVPRSAAPPQKDKKIGAFDKYAGSDEMKRFMRISCEECIKKLV